MVSSGAVRSPAFQRPIASRMRSALPAPSMSSPRSGSASGASTPAALAGLLGDVPRHGLDFGVAQAPFEGGHSAAAVSDLTLRRREVGLHLVEVRADLARRTRCAEYVATAAARREDLLAVRLGAR